MSGRNGTGADIQRLADLVTRQGIAELYGVDHRTVDKWVVRYRDFPRPANWKRRRGRGRIQPVYWLSEVEEWVEHRRAERPSFARTKP